MLRERTEPAIGFSPVESIRLEIPISGHPVQRVAQRGEIADRFAFSAGIEKLL